MGHHRTRRQLLAAAGGAAGLGGLAGCSLLTADADPPDAEEVHVLTFFGNDDWDRRWDDLTSGFAAESGTEVTVEYLLPGRERQRLETLTRSGRPPELFQGGVDTTPDLVGAGRTRSVGDVVADVEAATGDLVAPGSVRTEGEVHVVPHGLSLGGILNYRADVYEELGLSVPETWAELRENARAIDESDAVDARGMAVSASYGGRQGRAQPEFTNWLYTAGGDYWRWRDEATGEVELDFAQEDVRAVLEFMRDLSEYSPDPSILRSNQIHRAWQDGRVAQAIMDNAWLAGSALRADEPEIARHTEQALLPLRERGLDPIDRGWARFEGWIVLEDAGNPDAGEDLLRYTYGEPERAAATMAVEPMRYLPPYEGVLDAEAYRRAKPFQFEDGLLLEANRRCLDEFAPHLGGERPRNAAALTATNSTIVGETVEAVVADGADVDEAIRQARSDLQRRFEEARDAFED